MILSTALRLAAINLEPGATTNSHTRRYILPMRAACCAVLAFLAFVIPATADWQWNDILAVPPDIIQAADVAMCRMAADLGISPTVVDYGVVGSYAHGCARLGGPYPSDLDLVFFLTTNGAALEAHFSSPSNLSVRTRYEAAFKSALGFPHDIGFHFGDVWMSFPNDENFIFYSLKTRSMRGRPDGTPRRIKCFILLENRTFINVDRDRYNEAISNYTAQLRTPIHKQFISNDYLYFGVSPSNLLFSLPAVRLQSEVRQ